MTATTERSTFFTLSYFKVKTKPQLQVFYCKIPYLTAMAAVFQDTDAIKLALLEELSGTLATSSEVRKKAEERLHQLKFTGMFII